MLFVWARAAAAGPGLPCPQMHPSNVFMQFLGSRFSCSVTSPICSPGDPIQFGIGALGYNFGCSAHAFLWNFGDGTIAQTQSPAHVYVMPGVYTVSVTIANAQQQLTLTRSLTLMWIDDPPPPIEVHGLYDLGRAVPRGYVFVIGGAFGAGDWVWDFGDGTTTRGPDRVQSHVYARGGKFIVTLTSQGGSNTYAIAVNVPVERRRSARH